jgi:hypothetical protein
MDLAAVPTAMAIEGRPKFQCKTFNCLKPSHIQDIWFTSDAKCKNNVQVQSQEKVSYQVLQCEKHQCQPRYTCSMTQTCIVQYCGMYDCQTALPMYSYYDIPVAILIQTCQTIYAECKFYKGGVDHKVKMNSINLIKYEEVGRTYVDGREVCCLRQEWKIGTDLIDRMVVEIQVKLTLQEETYLTNTQEVITHFCD